MKKILIFLSAITLANCSDSYDDSKLWDSINGLENRVAKLEELCKQMNTNISSLQEIVTALQKNESIKSVATLPDGSGYLITFSSGKTITIYHGKNGEDGKDGYNGTDGVTPTISVKKDTDGIYYWTVNNDWLLVDGKKVKAEGTDGTDGEDGTNGKDGITPQFKIEDGYWYISYDNEQSWTKLGKATGDSGLNGTDGDNFFKGVSIEDGYVCFTLNDKDATIIKLPFVSESELTIEVKEPGTLKSLLTDEDMRTVISLKLVGSLNDDDFATIRYWMFVVENVDLSETDISEVPENAFREMHRLKKIILPESCTEIGDYAFYGCQILVRVDVPAVLNIGVSAFEECVNLENIEFPMSSEIKDRAFYNCRNLLNITFSDTLKTIGARVFYGCSSLTSIFLPVSLSSIGTEVFYECDNLTQLTFSGRDIFNNNVFSANNNIKNVVVAEGIVSLGRFMWGANVLTITLPKSLTSIAAYTFQACIYNHRTTKTNQKYPSVNL